MSVAVKALRLLLTVATRRVTLRRLAVALSFRNTHTSHTAPFSNTHSHSIIHQTLTTSLSITGITLSTVRAAAVTLTVSLLERKRSITKHTHHYKHTHLQQWHNTALPVQLDSPGTQQKSHSCTIKKKRLKNDTLTQINAQILQFCTRIHTQ